MAKCKNKKINLSLSWKINLNYLFRFTKPFVEKPINADDHNIFIYFPSSAGGGSQRLFRKVGFRSSVYSNEMKIRRNGSYIYEEFMPTGSHLI